MSKARPQEVRVWAIQDRSGHTNIGKRWVVRWVVDAKRFSKSFRTRAEGDRYRSRLLVAHQDGDRFDIQTGLPDSWSPRGGAGNTLVHAWARVWVAEHWAEWQPHTRREEVYALSRFIPHVTRAGASAAPADLRTYLRASLQPGEDVDADHPCERWLSRSVLALNELDRTTLAEVSRKLGVGDNDQALANETARRYRRVAHSCIRRAVELDQIPTDPWPPTPRGRSRRKLNRSTNAVDIRRLPSPARAVAIIAALKSRQPASLTYQTMTAVVFYAGLRPSEVVMLRPRALTLPSKGWGTIDVTEADNGWDEPGDPKTGKRTTPMPPILVDLLQSWIDDHELGADDLLFRTRRGNRPSRSNWSRALKRACESASHRRVRVYDFRHANATMMLRAGVPLAEAARRLGHSVETLVSTYVGAMDGDDKRANQLIDQALSGTTGDEGDAGEE